MLHAADDLQKFKYIIKNTADPWGKSVTFMPKPVFGDNGSGMHCHQSLWNDGEPLFYDEKGYAGLSDIARWYIGGLLKHSSAVLAFTNPTVNSYRRLVQGFEAPVNMVYSQGNRSAYPHPDHGHQPQGQAHRVPRSGPLLQPVPGVRCPADGRHRRHPQPHRAAGSDRQGPLRASGRGSQGHPAGARARSRRRSRRSRRQRVPPGGRRVHPGPDRHLDRLQVRERDQAPRSRPNPYEFELYYGV